MKTIRNASSSALRIHDTNQLVNPGGTVEVPDELAASLCEQPANWSRVTKTKSKKITTSEED